MSTAKRLWTAAGRLTATLAGLVLVWMAVTMLIGDSLIAPSATSEGEAELVITHTWYGEAMRYASAGLLGFLGATLAIAPWRNALRRRRAATAPASSDHSATPPSASPKEPSA